MKNEKYPLGLRPRFLVIQARIREILEALDRYNSALKPIPKGWTDELSALAEELGHAVENFKA